MTGLCTLTVLCLYVCPVFVGSQLLSASSSSSKRVSVSASASVSAQPFEVTAVYATTPLNDGSFVTTGENEALPNPYAVVTVYADVSQATVATYALQGFGDPMVSARTKQGGERCRLLLRGDPNFFCGWDLRVPPRVRYDGAGHPVGMGRRT